MTPTPKPPSWAVYHVWVEATRPAAKFKYFIALHCQGQSVLGILINSRVNLLGQGDQLSPCFAPLAMADHPYLQHDSWADCTTVFTLPAESLTDYRGDICLSAAQGVMTAFEKCPVLKPKTKALMLGVPLP